MPAPPPPARPTGSPTRVGPRRRRAPGHRGPDPPRGGGHLEADLLHPRADLRDLLRAGPRPRSLRPGPVQRWAAARARRGERLEDEDTSPSGKARARRPESALHRRRRWLGFQTHQGASEDGLGCARRVKLGAGRTTLLPDTPANQREDPQGPSQRPGWGFPIARFGVIFSWATGTVLNAAIGQYPGKPTGEDALVRRLFDDLEPEDGVLGDRYYCSDFDIAMLRQRGVDSGFRWHQRRPCDFRRGERLGKEDPIVTWSRPARPGWMTEEIYHQIPDTMGIRQVRIPVGIPGFRTPVLDRATTLWDAEMYKRSDLASLSRQRWPAERDRRSIQIGLGRDLMRCRAPELVGKAIGMTLRGSTVIRAARARAAGEPRRDPRRLRFKGALPTVPELAPGLGSGSAPHRRWWWSVMGEAIAHDPVGPRPDRVEPRARQRRPKPDPWRTRPRRQARTALLKAG